MSRDRLDRRSIAHLIDINTADAATLYLLPGIGTQLAQRVIEYRTRHGSFESIERLQDVKGIGRRTVQHLRPFATASARPASDFAGH